VVGGVQSRRGQSRYSRTGTTPTTFNGIFFKLTKILFDGSRFFTYGNINFSYTLYFTKETGLPG